MAECEGHADNSSRELGSWIYGSGVRQSLEIKDAHQQGDGNYSTRARAKSGDRVDQALA